MHSISASEQSKSSYQLVDPSEVVGRATLRSLQARSRQAHAIVGALNIAFAGVRRLSLRYDHARCDNPWLLLKSSTFM